jgi:hypothetical protein
MIRGVLAGRQWVGRRESSYAAAQPVRFAPTGPCDFALRIEPVPLQKQDLPAENAGSKHAGSNALALHVGNERFSASSFTGQ